MNNLRSTIVSFTKPILRYHTVIFIVIITIGLAAAVLLLNGIIGRTSGGTLAPSGGQADFDQTTIDRIKQLKTSADPSTPLDFSKGRISPFSE